jgi:hypothetical protein
MAEKPIFFKPWKIKVIQEWDFEKQGPMQTRRDPFIILPSPARIEKYEPHETGWMTLLPKDKGKTIWLPTSNSGKTGIFEPRYLTSCYQPGDHLWVREAWFPFALDRPEGSYYHLTHYQAIYTGKLPHGEHWHSPMMMHKNRARLWLEVLDVKVERVQDIPHKDAIAEGIKEWIESLPPKKCEEFELREQQLSISQLAYSYLWDIIYKKKPEFQWQANPWVWVYALRRIEK